MLQKLNRGCGWLTAATLVAGVACGACDQPDMPDEAVDEATAQQALSLADGFWKAAIAHDWDTMCDFTSTGEPAPLEEQTDVYCAGLVDMFENRSAPVELLKLGQPYREGHYPGVFVPYRVRLRSATETWTKEFRLAVRNDNPQRRFVMDGGI